MPAIGVTGQEPGPDCMGCRTAGGAHLAEEIYRDEHVVVVVAQHAVNPGHLVLVTTDHVRNALDMSHDLLAHLMRVSREMAVLLREKLPCESVMFLMNNEAPAQSLMHAHLHVVPRLPGDSIDFKWGTPVPTEERLMMAARLTGTPSNQGMENEE